jgi:Ca2+-binding EF-hand superfamily protein
MISRDTNTTFLNTTSAIPGKLLKDGYKKIKSKSNNVSAAASHNQSTSQQAKSLAKRIYHNLMGPEPTRDYMVEADLYPYFRTQEEAATAFRLFDVDGNGDISKRELRSGCIRIYRERKNLARSMRDLSQATGKMDIILLVIFTAIWVKCKHSLVYRQRWIVDLFFLGNYRVCRFWCQRWHGIDATMECFHCC